MSEAKQGWQSFLLTIAVTAVLTLGGACYAQLDNRVVATAAKVENQEGRIIRLETVLELELKRLNEKIDEIRNTLKARNEHSGTGE